MRILALLTDAFGSYGGIAEYNRNLLKALCSYPDISEVVAIPRLQPFETGPLPANLTYVTRGLNSKLKYVQSIWKESRENPCFSLIVIGHLNLLPLVWLLKLETGVPVWLQLHGTDAWPARNRFYLRCLKRVSTCVSVSETTKKRFRKWSGFPEERFAILPNSVDLNRFTPGSKRTGLMNKYGLSGRLVLLTLGRLHTMERAKGLDEVMEVLPELLKEIPNLTYLICGDGSDRPRLEAKARSFGVENRVVFAGLISEGDKVDHYRLADGYVMPSRGEGFGIAFIEALACGLPVVASNIDGSREAVRDPSWGILVDPDNPEEVKQGIREVLRWSSGVRPAGLEYFSDTCFVRRAHRLIGTLLASGKHEL